MKLFRGSQKSAVAPVAEEFPGPGITIDEINAVVAALFAQRPSLDQRVLSISVEAPARVRVVTGSVTGGLAANTNIVDLTKYDEGWRAASVTSLQS